MKKLINLSITLFMMILGQSYSVPVYAEEMMTPPDNQTFKIKNGVSVEMPPPDNPEVEPKVKMPPPDNPGFEPKVKMPPPDNPAHETKRKKGKSVKMPPPDKPITGPHDKNN